MKLYVSTFDDQLLVAYIYDWILPIDLLTITYKQAEKRPYNDH